MDPTAHQHRRPIRTIAAAVLAAALLLALACGAAAASVLPPGFHDRPVAEGLDQPTGLALAPDGRLFIAEKAGRVRVVSADGRLAREPLLDITAQVNAHWDRGLVGIAVDPTTAPDEPLRLYLLYVQDLPEGGDSDAATSSRVTRYVVDGESVHSPQTVLGAVGPGPCPPQAPSLDCIPNDGPMHAGGTLHVGDDRTLWVGIGDGVTTGRVDELALRTRDETSLAGKILHVDENGRGLSGHPFCPGETDLDKVCTKVYAKGFRNPFRASLTANGLLVGDVGWAAREEIDLVAPGRDYGWPCREGSLGTVFAQFAACSSAAASSFAAPAYEYAHQGGGSVVGGPVYTGTSYPDSFRGRAFFGDYAQRFIKVLSLDDAGAVTGVSDFATDLIPAALAADADGDLLFVSLGRGGPTDGVVRRIVYSPGNAPPRPRSTATPAAGPAPLEVQLSAAGSSDPDGDALSYTWDFGDGTTVTGAEAVHTFARGSYLVRLTARDGRGLDETTSLWVDAGNAPPQIELDVPALASLGTSITARATAVDDEDGAVAADIGVVLVHGDHRHPLATGIGELPFTLTPDHDADSWYEVTARASDRYGREGIERRRVDVRSVPLTLTSEPEGAPLSYAGQQVTAPVNRPAAVGFRTTVSAAERFERDGREYRFAGWSDGGAAIHDITVPDGPARFVARYTTALEPPPAAVLPPLRPATSARSRSRPQLTWSPPRRGATSLAGSVTALPPATALEVALARRGGRGCRWWRFGRGRHRAAWQPCARGRGWHRVRLRTVGGRRRWSVRLGGPLPSGRRLVLRARAVGGPQRVKVLTRRSPVKAAPATR